MSTGTGTAALRVKGICMAVWFRKSQNFEWLYLNNHLTLVLVFYDEQ